MRGLEHQTITSLTLAGCGFRTERLQRSRPKPAMTSTLRCTPSRGRATGTLMRSSLVAGAILSVLFATAGVVRLWSRLIPPKSLNAMSGAGSGTVGREILSVLGEEQSMV